jgi:hypothetical protein
MAIDFISSRGCVYVVRSGAGSGNVNGYSLSGFPTGGSYPIILTNASVTDSDLILPAATLNNHKIIYTFGEDFGNIQVNGSVFLGPVGQATEGLSPVIAYFQANGVARNGGKPVSLSMPGKQKFKMYLQTLQIMQANAALNMHEFLLTGIKAEPPQ